MFSDTKLPQAFRIMHLMAEAKLILDAAGREGQIEYIKALIRSGTAYPLRIIDEVARVTGAHIRDEIELVIDEGENVHWRREGSGELYVIEA